MKFIIRVLTFIRSTQVLKWILAGGLLVGSLWVYNIHDTNKMERLENRLLHALSELESERVARERLQISVAVDRAVLDELLHNQSTIARENEAIIRSVLDYVDSISQGEVDIDLPDLGDISNEERDLLIERHTLQHLYNGMFTIYCRASRSADRNDTRCPE